MFGGRVEYPKLRLVGYRDGGEFRADAFDIDEMVFLPKTRHGLIENSTGQSDKIIFRVQPYFYHHFAFNLLVRKFEKCEGRGQFNGRTAAQPGARGQIGHHHKIKA